VEAPGGVEPPTNGLGNRCSIQLSYGAAPKQFIIAWQFPATGLDGNALIEIKTEPFPARGIRSIRLAIHFELIRLPRRSLSIPNSVKDRLRERFNPRTPALQIRGI
jgi:hypothetical protein